MDITEGQVFRFKASASNSGVTVRDGCRIIPVTRNGKPVMAGDIEVGEEITINRVTGEIKPQPPAQGKESI